MARRKRARRSGVSLPSGGISLYDPFGMDFLPLTPSRRGRRGLADFSFVPSLPGGRGGAGLDAAFGRMLNPETRGKGYLPRSRISLAEDIWFHGGAYRRVSKALYEAAAEKALLEHELGEKLAKAGVSLNAFKRAGRKLVQGKEEKLTEEERRVLEEVFSGEKKALKEAYQKYEALENAEEEYNRSRVALERFHTYAKAHPDEYARERIGKPLRSAIQTVADREKLRSAIQSLKSRLLKRG